jgi:ribosomal protein S12 methylthiotransferase accessory factor
MYGEELLDNVTGSVSGEIRFFGLTPTNMKLDGIEKHLMLIKSYEKLQDARSRHHVSTSV